MTYRLPSDLPPRRFQGPLLPLSPDDNEAVAKAEGR